MSGLFLRLAAQATGQRGMLHSPARLPYQAPPERLEQAFPAWPAMAPAAERAVVQRQQAAAPESSAVRLPPPIGREESARQAMPRAAAKESALPLPQSPAPAGRHGEPIPSEPSLWPDAPLRNPVDTAMPTRSAAPESSATVQAQAALQPSASVDEPRAELSRLPRAELHADGHSSAPRPELRAAQPVPAAVALPPPLLPANAPHAPSPQQSAAPQVAPAVSAHAPDEVHIHIGRIEVTAIQENKPASKASRKGTPPLSLDAYLARRKGDGR